MTAVGGSPLSAELLETYASAGAERYLYGIGIPMDEGQLADQLEHVLAAQAELAGTS